MKIQDFQHIVWDFNGTLFDDVDIGITCVNLLLSRRNLPEIMSVSHYRELFTFPIEEYYRRAGFDFTRESYKSVADEWIREYRSRESEVPLRPDVYPILSKFRTFSIPQTVISASETGFLRFQLSRLGILDFFEETVGIDNAYAAGKAEVAAGWKERRKPGRVLMIGDTEHDAAVARQNGFDCALVSVGHASEAALRRTGYPVFSDFSTLEKELFP